MVYIYGVALPGKIRCCHKLAVPPSHVILKWQQLCAVGDRAADLGPDGGVQVLSQAGARGDRLDAGEVQRLRVSDRNECASMAQRVQAEGNPHRVRGPDRGIEQDERGHRARGGVDGAAAQADGVVRPHLAGLPIYKMTGSGNDFVMVDGRHTSPADWSEADIRAVCARGTGVGADGLVFVSPGSSRNAVRMIYFNADASRAAMCGNAADRKSTRLNSSHVRISYVVFCLK